VKFDVFGQFTFMQIIHNVLHFNVFLFKISPVHKMCTLGFDVGTTVPKHVACPTLMCACVIMYARIHSVFSMLSATFNLAEFRHPPPVHISKCIKRLCQINYTLSINGH